MAVSVAIPIVDKKLISLLRVVRKKCSHGPYISSINVYDYYYYFFVVAIVIVVVITIIIYNYRYIFIVYVID